MIEYHIKTWTCDDCGYTQDFEPTKELMEKHFNKSARFKLGDIKEGECPSCALKGARDKKVTKETKQEKKMKFRHFEQVDIDNLRSELESEEPQDVVVGEEYRVETDEEKTARVKQEVRERKNKLKLKKEEVSSLELELLAQPSITRKFKVKRKETSLEKSKRIEKIMSNFRAATPEEIAEARSKYEDK